MTLPSLKSQQRGGEIQHLHEPRGSSTGESGANRTTTRATSTNIYVKSWSNESDRLLSLPLETTATTTASATLIQSSENRFRKKIILFLLWCVAWLSALDRVAMSVALLPISDEYGYTDSMKGAISSLFSVGYGLAILPAGILVATISPRIVMALGVALWSVSTIATPAAVRLAVDNIMPLLLVRACVGAGESVVLPTIQRLVQSWMQPDEKSLALAVIISGFHSGTITALLLSPIVIEVLGGWQSLFYCYGGAGLVLLLPWLILARDAPTVTNAGAAVSESEPKSPSISWSESIRIFRDAPWKEFGRSKAVWAMILTHCSSNWGLYNYLAWMPIFYSEQYDIGVRDSAWLSVLPSVAGAAGGLFAGWVADSIIQNLKENDTQGIANVRKLFQCLSSFGPAVAFAGLAWRIPEEPRVAQAFLTVAVFFMTFEAAGNEICVQDKAGLRWVGLLYCVTNLPAVMVGTLGVYITGQVLDMTNQDWSYVFGLNAFVYVLGAVAFLAWYDSKREFE
jgi:ACS family sodium-dependent inorganic phosphate cotransporter